MTSHYELGLSPLCICTALAGTPQLQGIQALNFCLVLFVSIPIFCKLPEAVAISGEEVEIPINSQSADAGFFNHEIEYDDNTLDQLIALTKVSSKCTQTFEFNCFWAPMKDLVS